MKVLIGIFLVIGLAFPASQAQSSADSPRTSTPALAHQDLLKSLLRAETPELLFRPDDLISVRVYDLKNYAVQQRVEQDGTMALPFLGKVQVAGLTVEQLESQVARDLIEKGIDVHDPQVIITAISRPSAVVTVSGDVSKPGTFPAYGRLTLMDYLSDAGGLQENIPDNAVVNSPASLTVTLIRPSLGQPVKIPLGPDATSSEYGKIPLFAGDEVQVSPVGMVYAIGAFKTQGAYALKNSSPTTVLQLAAMAGGIGYQAKWNKAYIVRTQGGKRYVLDINLSKIQKGTESDPALQADDILLAPTNAMKAALKNGGIGVITGLASAYIYAHP